MIKSVERVAQVKKFSANLLCIK